MELRWRTSFSASCLHAAACLGEGLPPVEGAANAEVDAAATALLADLEACGLSAARTLPRLVGLAADYENNRQLVEIAVTRLQGAGRMGPADIGRLAGRIADLEAANLRARPALLDELAARSRPLREQWDARGPGLIRQMATLAGDSFIAPSAEVVLVAPLAGGHGRAHLLLNRVTFEAVLANPLAELPEALRLGWLLAQLNIDVPAFSDLVPGPRLHRVAGLATLPLVLSAAKRVEWAALTSASIAQALVGWHFPTDLPQDVAERLLGWWHAYETGGTRWSVAIGALDALLEN